MLTLRPTSPGDGHALAELLAVVWAGQENGAAYHGGGRRPGVVAVCAGKLVGYGQLWHSRLHPTYAYAGVHVHPQWRGQGIGGELWNAVTKDVEQPLKAKTYATQSAAVRFLQRRGLRVSVETLEPMLWPADLEDVTPWVRAAEQLGFVLRPMTELSDELRTQLLPLHREVYAHAHLHDPACPKSWTRTTFWATTYARRGCTWPSAAASWRACPVCAAPPSRRRANWPGSVSHSAGQRRARPSRWR
ncbi:GNAT family N-acetyltransferase [Deinococcus radiodurans]|nr:GNAT family N-acetyltransferase [Deinococcus radiodurans]